MPFFKKIVGVGEKSIGADFSCIDTEKKHPVGGSFDSQIKSHRLCPHLKCTLQNINTGIKQAVIDENINKMLCYIRVKGTYKIRLRERCSATSYDVKSKEDRASLLSSWS